MIPLFLDLFPVRELYLTWLDASHPREYCAVQFSQPIIISRVTWSFRSHLFPGASRINSPQKGGSAVDLLRNHQVPEKYWSSVWRKMMI